MIRILRGVSGYREDGSPYRYSAGSVVTDMPFIEHDLVKNGLARYEDVKVERPIAEPPVKFAVAPDIRHEKVITAVVRRGKKTKRNV